MNDDVQEEPGVVLGCLSVGRGRAVVRQMCMFRCWGSRCWWCAASWPSWAAIENIWMVGMFGASLDATCSKRALISDKRIHPTSFWIALPNCCLAFLSRVWCSYLWKMNASFGKNMWPDSAWFGNLTPLVTWFFWFLDSWRYHDLEASASIRDRCPPDVSLFNQKDRVGKELYADHEWCRLSCKLWESSILVNDGRSLSDNLFL